MKCVEHISGWIQSRKKINNKKNTHTKIKLENECWDHTYLALKLNDQFRQAALQYRITTHTRLTVVIPTEPCTVPSGIWWPVLELVSNNGII